MCFKKLYKKWLFNRFVKKQVKELNERIDLDPSLKKLSDEIWGELKRENSKAMETNFTKGSWLYRMVKNISERISCTIYAQNGDVICKMMRDDSPNYQIQEDNAKLISASPDLYHALDDLIKHSSKFVFRTQEEFDTWADLKEKAVKALRKAEEGVRL